MDSGEDAPVQPVELGASSEPVSYPAPPLTRSARSTTTGAASGAPGALVVPRTGSREALDRLLADDPFARTGVIAQTEVREWNVIVGPGATATA